MSAAALDAVRAELVASVETLGAAPGLDTYLARGGDLETATVTRIELAVDVAAEVTADLVRLVTRLAGGELLAYDPAYQPSGGQALVTELADAPALERLHSHLVTDDVPTDTGGEVVRAMAHRLHGGGSVVGAYRVKGAGIATRRPRGLRALLPRDGIYERVDEEVVYYEPRVDVWVIGAHALFTTRTTLEQRLHAPEQAQRMARETFATVTEHIAIDGAEELAAAVASDPVMIAKMASLVQTMAADPDFAAHLTTSRLASFVAAHPQYGVKVDGAGDDRRLVFEPSPQTRYRIVKLLADDFLRSDLTQRLYEAGSKHRVVDAP